MPFKAVFLWVFPHSLPDLGITMTAQQLKQTANLVGGINFTKTDFEASCELYSSNFS